MSERGNPKADGWVWKMFLGGCGGAEEAKFSARIDPTYGTTGQVHINR